MTMMRQPRDKRKDKRLSVSHKRAPKQEAETAEALGGTLVPGSGSQAIKGDVRVKGVARIENKCTKNKSYSLTLETIEKIEAAASSGTEMEVPVIHVEFIHPDTGQRIKGVYVVPEGYLEELIVRAKNATTSDHAEKPRGSIVKQGRR